jgi:hypothetical protein
MPCDSRQRTLFAVHAVCPRLTCDFRNPTMCGQCTTNILNYFFVSIGRSDTSSKSMESGSEDDMLVPRNGVR